MGSLALLPVGYVLAGPLATRAGEREVLLVGGLLGAGAAALALLPRSTRSLRSAPGASPGPAEALLAEALPIP